MESSSGSDFISQYAIGRLLKKALDRLSGNCMTNRRSVGVKVCVLVHVNAECRDFKLDAAATDYFGTLLSSCTRCLKGGNRCNVNRIYYGYWLFCFVWVWRPP